MSTYANGELLSIEYKVSIDGKELDQYRKECITNIDIKETVDGANSATINISDPEMVFIEDDIFLEDKEIVIELGWSTTTYRVTFSGYISSINIDFASDGIPKLTIDCLDETYKMSKEKKDNTYDNTTSAEVVKQIATDYGFSCVVSEDYEFPEQESITQSDQTDIEFLRGLADSEVHPFAVKLEGNTLHYEKKGELTEPVMTLTYREYPHEIISFNPSINKEKKEKNVESATMDTASKDVDSSESNSSGTSTDKSMNIETEAEATVDMRGRKFDAVNQTWRYEENTKNAWG